MSMKHKIMETISLGHCLAAGRAWGRRLPAPLGAAVVATVDRIARADAGDLGGLKALIGQVRVGRLDHQQQPGDRAGRLVHPKRLAALVEADGSSSGGRFDVMVDLGQLAAVAPDDQRPVIIGVLAHLFARCLAHDLPTSQAEKKAAKEIELKMIIGLIDRTQRLASQAQAADHRATRWGFGPELTTLAAFEPPVGEAERQAEARRAATAKRLEVKQRKRRKLPNVEFPPMSRQSPTIRPVRPGQRSPTRKG